MTRERYFSPGTAPFERFARGVYDALPKSFAEANKMFNPVEVLQEASGKSRRFFESGGKDRQAGIEALIDTAMLGVGPAAYGVASLLRTPAKKSVDYATKAFQELFNPLGASDDRVVETGTKGMTRRDFLGGTGAGVILAGAPILKEVGELLPEKGVVKTSADLFRQSLKNSNAAFSRIIQLQDAVKKADEATMKASREAIDKGLADPLEELFILKPKPDFVKKLEESQDVAVEVLNKNLSEFVKDLTREKLLKLSDEELSILNKLKHVSPHKIDSTGNMSGFGKVFENAGEPLRQRYIYDPDKDLYNLVLDPESVRVSELIDSVLIERGLFDRFIGLTDDFKESTAIINDAVSAKSDIGKAEGGVISLKDKAVNMTKNPKGIDSLVKTATDMYK